MVKFDYSALLFWGGASNLRPLLNLCHDPRLIFFAHPLTLEFPRANIVPQLRERKRPLDPSRLVVADFASSERRRRNTPCLVPGNLQPIQLRQIVEVDPMIPCPPGPLLPPNSDQLARDAFPGWSGSRMKGLDNHRDLGFQISGIFQPFHARIRFLLISLQSYAVRNPDCMDIDTQSEIPDVCPLCGFVPEICRCGRGEWVAVSQIDPDEQYVPKMGDELQPHIEMRLREDAEDREYVERRKARRGSFRSPYQIVEYRALSPTGGRLLTRMVRSFRTSPYALPEAQWPAGLWREWIAKGAQDDDEWGEL